MEQIPAIVFKYFNWDDIESKKILTEKELFFCNADRWKKYGEYDFKFKPIDKQRAFDRIEAAVYKTRNEDFSLFEKWFNLHVSKYKIDVSTYDSLDPIVKDNWEARIVDEIIHHRVNDIIVSPEDYETSTRNYYYKNTGIFSTSLTNHSKQLWGWKSNFRMQKNDNAVCIGLNLTKIKQKLDSIGNYSLGIIDYVESLNEVEFIGSGNDFLVDQFNNIIFTLNKGSVFNNTEQKELRITKFLINDDSKQSPERFMKIDDDFITEVFVNSNATTKAKAEIEIIAKKLGCTLTYVTL